LKAKALLSLGPALVPVLISAQDLGHEYEFDAAPFREGEKAVIPLDTKDPSYNLFRQLRDLSDGPKREPGSRVLPVHTFLTDSENPA